MEDTNRLYGDLAPWWPLLSAPEEYAEEAEVYRRVLVAAAHIPVCEVLELGSGGGNNASHLEAAFTMTLVDRSPAMLDVSRALNPELEHVEGDMRTVRLDREFDAVFIHDAICYITTEEDLAAVAATARAHCRPGGVALLVPDDVAETFRPGTEHGGHDGDGRAARYLEWTHEPDPNDTVSPTDMVYLLRDGNEVSVVHERHMLGLFPTRVWLAALEAAGFRARFEAVELNGNETLHLFIGVAESE